MKRRVLPAGLLLIIVVLIGAALYGNGDYIVYMLTYIFSFVFLFCLTVFAASAVLEKIVQTIVYALVLAAQILFAVLVMRPADGTEQLLDLYRLLGVLIVPAPFLIRQICFFQHTANCIAPSVNDWATLSYAQLVQDQELITEKVSKATKAGKILSKGRLREIVEDLPRHNSFSYINNGSLTNEYFHTAEESLFNCFTLSTPGFAKTKTNDTEQSA